MDHLLPAREEHPQRRQRAVAATERRDELEQPLGVVPDGRQRRELEHEPRVVKLVGEALPDIEMR